MKKEQFISKYKNLNIPQAELERKWRVLREEEDMRMLWKAQRDFMLASTVGATGGSLSEGSVYGVSSYGIIYSIDTFNVFATSPQIPFPAETICCGSGSTYFYYLFYANSDYNGFYFGTIDSNSGEIHINNNGNLLDVAQNKTPSSLYLEQSGTLIMLDAKFGYSTKNIIRIDTNYDGGIWNGVLISVVDPLIQTHGELILLFTVDGNPYGISSGKDPDNTQVVGRYDINTPEYSGITQPLVLYKNSDANITQQWPISAVQGADGKVDLIAYYYDSNANEYGVGLFDLNVSTGLATWIKDTTVNESDTIITLFTK